MSNDVYAPSLGVTAEEAARRLGQALGPSVCEQMKRIQGQGQWLQAVANPVSLGPAPLPTEEERHRCEYCGGRTRDDSHGNCKNCGAPREEAKPAARPARIPKPEAPPPDVITRYVGISWDKAWDNLVAGITFAMEVLAAPFVNHG